MSLGPGGELLSHAEQGRRHPWEREAHAKAVVCVLPDRRPRTRAPPRVVRVNLKTQIESSLAPLRVTCQDDRVSLNCRVASHSSYGFLVLSTCSLAWPQLRPVIRLRI